MAAAPLTTIPVQAQLDQDPLTGLGTLLAFLTRLDRALMRVINAGLPLAIVVIDLDGLADEARPRDEPAGEEAILRVAVALWTVVARQDPAMGATAFRLRDAQFALLLPGLDGLAARAVAVSLLGHEALDDLTLSIGVGIARADRTDLGRILLDAQGALRVSRQAGGRRIQLAQGEPVDELSATILVNLLARHIVSLGGRLEEAYRLALFDPISGLPNQQALARYLQVEVPRTVRYQRPLALLLVDGDNLKEFNTRLGYAAGDEWIRRLGELLVRETRGSDLVVRWRMGDEFMVALPETGPEAAGQIAERIRAAVEDAARQLPLRPTVSIGVASFPADANTSDALLLQAEAANQRAKTLGKNRVASAPGPA
ncbi:MAG TPA: diguanylate cyclase [Thermomicrobiales bacterium]|nr:diguanylate cyclase [Thermomicrobiales bacterium]